MGDVIKLGSIAVDRFTGIKTISGLCLLNTYNTMELPIGTPYQVGAITIFKSGLVMYNSDTAGARVTIGYGDSIVASSATPPTNYVAICRYLPVEVANRGYESTGYLYIPSGKYPCITSVIGSGSMMISGIEE